MDIHAQIINKGDLCFDVGANLGRLTEKFLTLGATVVAVEPNPVLANKLGGFSNKLVEVVPVALGKEVGILDLKICEAHTLSTLSDKFIKETGKNRFKNFHWRPAYSVPVSTLDNLIVTYGVPKYCKIDVEGFEYEVLQGLHEHIPVVSFEFTPELRNIAKQCIMYLEKLARYEYNFCANQTYSTYFPLWVSSDKLLKYLYSITDTTVFMGDIYCRLVGV